jgi:hypothetical protein
LTERREDLALALGRGVVPFGEALGNGERHLSIVP